MSPQGILSSEKASSVLTETGLLACGSITELRLNLGLAFPCTFLVTNLGPRLPRARFLSRIIATVSSQHSCPVRIRVCDDRWDLHSHILQRLIIVGTDIYIWTCARFLWLMMGTDFLISGVAYWRHQRPESLRNRTRSLLNLESCVEFNLWAPRFLYIGQAYRYLPENAFIQGVTGGTDRTSGGCSLC